MKEIIFYGAGYNAHEKAGQWIATGLMPVCFADADLRKQNTLFDVCGIQFEIMSLKDATEKYPDYILYLTQARTNISSVLMSLLKEGVPFERIRFCENIEIHDIIPLRFLIEEKAKIYGKSGCPIVQAHPHILIYDGEPTVYPCAPSDRPIPVENLNDFQPFEKVWNSGSINGLRTAIENWDYRTCSLLTCATRGRYLEALEFIDRKEKETGKTPLVIKFMHDLECNLHCLMCRDHVIALSQAELEKYNALIKTVFLPMCKNADAVYFAGNGEPFASRHYRNLIKAIADTYPNIKFLLHTNGNLCNEVNCEKLGILNRIDSVLISINAATKETYNKIARGGNWERVLKNIEWIKKSISDGKINALYFSFVVQKSNYKEMPQFVEFARNNNAKCRFTLCHREANSSISKCEENEVFHPQHPEFMEYCNILKNPVFDWDGCFLDPYSVFIRKIQAGYRLYLSN